MLISAELVCWLHLSGPIMRSIAARSVTTPIAIDVSPSIGIPVLTTVFVLLTGMTGLLLRRWIIRILRLRTAIGRGCPMGMGAHGIGSAKAFEESAREGRSRASP